MRPSRQTTAIQLAGLAAGAALAGAWWFGHRAPHSFRGASVLVTGGARGLGLVLARRFAAEGARVFLASRSRDELLRAERELRAGGGDVRSLVCDVRDAVAVGRTISRIVGETGRVDVVVNNAGIIQTTPVEHAQVDDFLDSLRTHFWGPFNVVRAALPWMRRQRSGRIVNIASIGGRVAVPHLLPYAVGKFALVGFSQGLQAELRKDGILVTTVVPGLMRTGSHQRVQIRGQHTREAQWFALGVATPITSMAVERAAAQIVEATRRGRAHATLGWQARLMEIAAGVAPELTADVLASVASHALPGPSPRADGARRRQFSEVEKGWVEPFLPDGASERNNEVPPPT